VIYLTQTATRILRLTCSENGLFVGEEEAHNCSFTHP